MKYERMTIERENGFATVRNTTLQGLIDRLAYLEDKIEAGTLVEVPRGAGVLTPEERAEEMRLCSEERKEAVKEFAKKLRDKEFSVKIGSAWFAVVKSRDIDELVKEVRGE